MPARGQVHGVDAGALPEIGEDKRALSPHALGVALHHAEIGAHMVYTTNEDVPGIIGALGQTMGQNGVNIANFTLGRSHRGGEAIAILYVDDAVPEPVLDKLRRTGMFSQVKAMEFDMA